MMKQMYTQQGYLKMKISFSHKSALIIGGSCDLGIKVALLMMDNGINPVLSYRSDKSLRKINEILIDKKGYYSTVKLDLFEIKTINNLNSEYSYVVDLAQTDYESLIASTNEEDLGRFINANVLYKGELLRFLSRKMILNKTGRFLYISSTAAGLINPGQAFYSATKNACESLYKGIGIELGRKGITSVILRPGYIKHGRGVKYLENNEKEILKRVPTRSSIDVDRLAEMIMFFLSDSSIGINATSITIDGGMSSCK